MGAPKYSSSELQKLYQEKQKEATNLQDKKMIEALKQRLNNKIQNSPELQKKAALIIEQWLNKKKK